MAVAALASLATRLAQLAGRGARVGAKAATRTAAASTRRVTPAMVANAERAAALRLAERSNRWFRPGTPAQRAQLAAALAALELATGSQVSTAVLDGMARQLGIPVDTPTAADIPDLPLPPAAPTAPTPPGAPPLADFPPAGSPPPLPPPPLPAEVPQLVIPLPSLPGPLPGVHAAPSTSSLVRVARVQVEMQRAAARLSRAQLRAQAEAQIVAELGAFARQVVASSGDVLATGLGTKWGAAALGVPLSIALVGGFLTADQRQAAAVGVAGKAPHWAPGEDAAGAGPQVQGDTPVVSPSGWAPVSQETNTGTIGGQPVSAAELGRFLSLPREQQAIAIEFLKAGKKDPFGVI